MFLNVLNACSPQCSVSGSRTFLLLALLLTVLSASAAPDSRGYNTRDDLSNVYSFISRASRQASSSCFSDVSLKHVTLNHRRLATTCNLRVVLHQTKRVTLGQFYIKPINSGKIQIHQTKDIKIQMTGFQNIYYCALRLSIRVTTKKMSYINK